MPIPMTSPIATARQYLSSDRMTIRIAIKIPVMANAIIPTTNPVPMLGAVPIGIGITFKNYSPKVSRNVGTHPRKSLSQK